MPNHVSNIIKADPEVIAGLVRGRTDAERTEHAEYEESRRQRLVKADGDDRNFKSDALAERTIDFNMVVPIPDDDDPRITATKSGVGGMVGWSMDGRSPMDFARELWGTKWNAYSQIVDDRDDMIQFETAWSHPYPVIEELSRKFPEHEIECKYADEDFGCNLGHYKIKNGEITWDAKIEDNSPEAMEFAAQVRFERSYEELRVEWDQEEIDSTRKAVLARRMEEERGVENGYTVIREEGLEIPQDIIDQIQSVFDAESYWESAR